MSFLLLGHQWEDLRIKWEDARDVMVIDWGDQEIVRPCFVRY